MSERAGMPSSYDEDLAREPEDVSFSQAEERAAKWAREYVFDGETSVEAALREAYLAGTESAWECPAGETHA